MHGVPWQVMQELISVIPPTEDAPAVKDNKSMDFFDFGKKLMGI